MMNKLKIALYTRSFPPKSGGVSTAHYNIYKLLKEHYDVKMFVYDEQENLSTEAIEKRKNITWISSLIMGLIKLKYRKKSADPQFNNVKKIVGSFIPILKLNKALRAFKPDVIIVPDNFVPAYMLKVPKNAKLVCFAHHNYSRFKNQPLLVDQDWLDLSIANSMECKSMQKVNAVIAPSNYMIERFKNTTYASKPIFLIPNFMESSIFSTILEQSKQHSVFPVGKKVIYIPSAGSDIKGKRFVFEIVRRLLKVDKDVFFYLSGNLPGDLSFELESYDGNIYAPGHVTWEENLKNVMQCYMGVSPNIEENFSYAILEGQASGVPFVAFDTGGNKEIIIDGVTGFIVPYLDVEALIEKSVVMLNSAEQQACFKISSVERCHTRFNSDVILENYQSALKSISILR